MKQHRPSPTPTPTPKKEREIILSSLVSIMMLCLCSIPGWREKELAIVANPFYSPRHRHSWDRPPPLSHMAPKLRSMLLPPPRKAPRARALLSVGKIWVSRLCRQRALHFEGEHSVLSSMWEAAAPSGKNWNHILHSFFDSLLLPRHDAEEKIISYCFPHDDFPLSLQFLLPSIPFTIFYGSVSSLSLPPPPQHDNCILGT